MAASAAESLRVLYFLTDPMSTRLVRGQLAYLRSQGFDVELATAPGPDLDEAGRREGVRTHAVPFVREPSVWRDLRALVATIHLLWRRKPAMVNASTPKAGLLGMFAAKVCRVPVRIYVVRGLRFETTGGMRRRLLKATEWVALRCSTGAIFNSHSLRSLARSEGLVSFDEGVVLAGGSGNGVDVQYFSQLPDRSAARRALGLDPEATVVGFVGRLVNDKGIADAVTVVNDVARHLGGIQLLIVGNYEDGDLLSSATRRALESDDRVVRRNWLSDTRVAYAAMDVLLFASYREGLPNVPLEAQAAQVPVVGYEATGTVDAVADGTTGRLVPVGNLDALRDALRELVEDVELRREMGRAGGEWVAANFQSEQLWAALVSLFGALLDKERVTSADAKSNVGCSATFGDST